MKDKDKKDALVKVFNVIGRDGIFTGIPDVPGLSKAITCAGCEVKTKHGVPIGIGEFMSADQKAEFKTLTSYRSKKKKRISQVPHDVVINEG